MKTIISIFATFLIIVLSFSTTFAKARWVKVGDNWRYELHENGGDYVTEKWRSIYDSDGVTLKVYYFDYYGNMVTGPVVINGKLYVYGDDGAAVTTGFDINGLHYNTSGNGEVLGIPQLYDLSVFPVANTQSVVFAKQLIENAEGKYYDDNNNKQPTAPPQYNQ